MLLLTVVCCIPFCAAVIVKKKEQKVLFIGNSLTFYNDMPQTLQKMIDEQQLNIKIDQFTLPGCRLTWFAANIEHNNNSHLRAQKNETPMGVKKILSDKWDYVILQEGGGDPLIPYLQMYSFEPSLLFLDSIIRSIKARTVIYQAFTGNEFPRQLCKDKSSLDDFVLYPGTVTHSLLETRQSCSNYYKNSTEEFHDIKLEYDKMAKRTKAGMVKIGYAFEAFKKSNRNINLYAPDNGHPSKQGSYLIACMFFKYFTGKPLTLVKYAATLDAKEAAIIRKFADTIK